MQQQPAAVAALQEGPAGQPRSLPLPGGPTSTCTICGCDLTGQRLFHIRYRVCPEHATADVVMNKGVASRFCQQCGRFHPLEAFEPSLRSCRQQLARHAARRRERRRLAAAAKAAMQSDGALAAGQRPAGQQKRRQAQTQQAHQQAQQPAGTAGVAMPASHTAGQLVEMPAAERAGKRRRTASEASTLSSHEAGAAAVLATGIGSGGSSSQQPAMVDTKVPLLAAVPASLPATTLAPAWALQAAGLPLPVPQPVAPAWAVAPALPAEQRLPADTHARAAEAALLLSALMRDPAIASVLSPLQQVTPRQLSDPAALPSEAAEGAALSDDAAGSPQRPNTWEAASQPLPGGTAPLQQLPPSPQPTQAHAAGLQRTSTALPPPPVVLPPCDLPPVPAAPEPHSSGLAAVAAGLQRAAAQELISRVQLAQRDFGMECLLLRLTAMSPAECEAQLVQLLAGMVAAGPSM